MDPDTGVFNAPVGGSYMFVFHIATHDNKKALLSIRLNGEEVASVFDQNHKDNHKNSMAGQTISLIPALARVALVLFSSSSVSPPTN